LLQRLSIHRSHGNRKIIEGDFFGSFQEVRKRSTEINSKFDLIMCRPEAGWASSLYPNIYSSRTELESDFDKYAKILAIFLNRYWLMLNVDGQMFVQMPRGEFSKQQIEEFFSSLGDVELKIDYKEEVFCIKKKSDSPLRLIKRS
jgi:hypothetical protein